MSQLYGKLQNMMVELEFLVILLRNLTNVISHGAELPEYLLMQQVPISEIWFQEMLINLE